MLHRGDHAGAEAVAREAVQIADRTDDPTAQADTRLVLAQVLMTADRRDESAVPVVEAIALYEAKGNALGAAYARTQIVV